MIVVEPMELAKRLCPLGINQRVLLFNDNSYAVPSRADIKDKVAPFWADLMKQLGFTYIPEARDCDKFSRMAAAVAGLIHSYQGVALEFAANRMGMGFALGEFFYRRDVGGYHAINFAVVDETMDVIFLEPQAGLAEVKLSQNEITSCIFCRV